MTEVHVVFINSFNCTDVDLVSFILVLDRGRSGDDGSGRGTRRQQYQELHVLLWTQAQ